MTAHAPSNLGPERPFPGLRPYSAADHAWFFGRQNQCLALYRLVERGRFVAVVGKSGDGKSSMVAAGLLPEMAKETRVREGSKERRPRWLCLMMQPGDAPYARLASEIAGPAPLGDEDERAMHDARRDKLEVTLRESSFGLVRALRDVVRVQEPAVLLVVDQFEEIFRFAALTGSAAADPKLRAERRNEAAAFVQLLLEASRDETIELHVMLTMRSDYIGDCAQFPSLAKAVASRQYLVPALTRDQREEIIRKPLKRAGATIDDDLVQRLLNDSTDEADQLPVLQHTLMRLWGEAGRLPESPAAPRHLTMAHYETIGGMTQALSQHADELLKELGERAQAVEQCFRALAELDKDNRAVRRALRFDRLLAETGVDEDDLRIVLDRFRADDVSFLRPPADQKIQAGTIIDVGHEALIRNWRKVSGVAGDIASSTGQASWLLDEADAGVQYRALLNIARGGPDAEVPLNQAERRWSWWNQRPRTAAWAERYGGDNAVVVKLLERSLAARRSQVERDKAEEQKRVEAERLERQRIAEQQRRELETARQERQAAQQLAQVRATFAWITSAVAVVAVLAAAVAVWYYVSANAATNDARKAKALAEQQRDQAEATALWSRLELQSDRLKRDEVEDLWDLAGARPGVRDFFVRQLKDNPVYLERLGRKARPVLSALGLRLAPEQRRLMLDTMLFKIEDESNPDTMAARASALAGAAPWLTENEADEAIDRVIDALRRAKDPGHKKTLLNAASALAAVTSKSKGEKVFKQLADDLSGGRSALRAEVLISLIGAFVSPSAMMSSQAQADAVIGWVIANKTETSLARGAAQILASHVSIARAPQLFDATLATMLNRYSTRSGTAMPLYDVIGRALAERLSDDEMQAAGESFLSVLRTAPELVPQFLGIASVLAPRLPPAFSESVVDIGIPARQRLEPGQAALWSEVVAQLTPQSAQTRTQDMLSSVLSSRPVDSGLVNALLHTLPVEAESTAAADILRKWRAKPDYVPFPSPDVAALASAAAAVPAGLTPDLAREQFDLALAAIQRTYDVDTSMWLGAAAAGAVAKLELSVAEDRVRPAISALRNSFYKSQGPLVDVLQALALRFPARAPEILQALYSFNLVPDDVKTMEAARVLVAMLGEDDAKRAFDNVANRLLQSPEDDVMAVMARFAELLAEKLSPDAASSALAVVIRSQWSKGASKVRDELGLIAAALDLRINARDRDIALARYELAASNSEEEAAAWAEVLAEPEQGESDDNYASRIVEMMKYPNCVGDANDRLVSALRNRYAGAPAADRGIAATTEWIAQRFPAIVAAPPAKPGKPDIYGQSPD